MRKIGLVSIIDDDPIFQVYVKRILQASEAVENIISFSDGEKAAEYFIRNKADSNRIPDLVFLDINMPSMDGWQFLDEIVNHEFSKKNITIYICTASNATYDRAKLISYSSLRGHLVKPLLKENMFTLLDLQLGENYD